MKISFNMRLVAVFTCLLVSGCGKWPDIVENASDIEKLDPHVTSVRARGLSDNDIPALSRLRNLQKLFMGMGHKAKKSRITDQGLYHLSRLDLPRLKVIDLGYCDKITDSGLLNLSEMNNVKDLSLSVCKGVTNAGLKHLANMDQLEWLDLRGCDGISDEGLKHLNDMRSLNDLLLAGCANVSEEAVAELQKALPDCRVSKDEKEWSYHR